MMQVVTTMHPTYGSEVSLIDILRTAAQPITQFKPVRDWLSPEVQRALLAHEESERAAMWGMA